MHTIQLMKTGHLCSMCGSDTTSGHWRRLGEGYMCGKCASKKRYRDLGLFQNFKEKKSARTCFRCGSNNTLEKTTPTGYHYKEWHTIDGEWHCYTCWCRKANTTLTCENCGESFLTNWVNKKVLRTVNKCKKCRTPEPKQQSEIKIIPCFESYQSKRKDIQERKCFNCGSDKTSTSFGSDGHPYKKWRRIDGEFHCSKCYDRIKTTPEQQWRKNANRIKYKGEYIRVPEILEKKTGYCQWCSNNIYDKTCKYTQFHHKDNIYDDKNPLWNTVELCPQCHTTETIRLTKEEAKK